VSELALAAFAAERGVHARLEERSARFAAFRKAFDGAKYLAALERRGLRWLSRSDVRFPPLLRAIHDAPSGLFLRGSGDPDVLARPAVAIVGARACSGYGTQVARMLGRELAAAGLVVVSGLARGVDGEAHRGALDAGGATVAVLGCGIDRDYPAAHAELARRIADTALVVSEYAPGVEPAPWRFPARKRKGVAAKRKRHSSIAVLAVDAAKCCARVVSVWSSPSPAQTTVRRADRLRSRRPPGEPAGRLLRRSGMADRQDT
jgi:DNA protecting protein DprA